VEITSTKTRLVPTRVRNINLFVRDAVKEDMDAITSGRSLVVLCTDALTGRPVDGSNVRVRMDSAKGPILKEDSYRIFTNIQGDHTVIHIKSAIYEAQDVEVDLNEWDGSKILEIELQPGEHYPRTEDRISFETEAE
jgi:hypothetical protein